jgi:hypothetical protein
LVLVSRKTTAETSVREILRAAFPDEAMSKSQKHLIAIRISEVAEISLKFSKDQVGYRDVGLTKIWERWVKIFTRTGGLRMTMTGNVSRKRTGNRRTQHHLQHQRCAPDLSALSVQNFLIKNNMTVFQRPYVPGAARCNFFLSRKMKT